MSALGEKRYLHLLSNAFQLLYRAGLLGKDYQDIYFLKRYIRKGDWCIDIGAHLGYYTLELGRLVLPTGEVLAVEPMSKFNKVLKNTLGRHKLRNVTVYPVALGGNGEYVEMGIPSIAHQKRFAYARVIDSSPGLDYVESEKVRNHSADQLFESLGRLDFVKCDVEGLEYAVFSSMLETLKKHHPVLLIEIIDRDHRIRLFELLKPLGYSAFRLENNKWHSIDVYDPAPIASQNNYFITAGQRERLAHLFTP
jgi:FkbM family methyltransferase